MSLDPRVRPDPAPHAAPSSPAHPTPHPADDYRTRTPPADSPPTTSHPQPEPQHDQPAHSRRLASDRQPGHGEPSAAATTRSGPSDTPTRRPPSPPVSYPPTASALTSAGVALLPADAAAHTTGSRTPASASAAQSHGHTCGTASLQLTKQRHERFDHEQQRTQQRKPCHTRTFPMHNHHTDRVRIPHYACTIPTTTDRESSTICTDS
jgi:hypothetical protein